MSHCLVNVEYFTEGHLIFFKKVSFAGFTSQNKLFSKEITYKYPTSSASFTEQLGGFGNLELKRLDEDVIKTLAKFSTIFVYGSSTKKFLQSYVTSYTKVIDIETFVSTEQE